jgi:hypothetical protein
VLAVGFHGAHAEFELIGNFLVAPAFGDEDEHFAFAGGQFFPTATGPRRLRIG